MSFTPIVKNMATVTPDAEILDVSLYYDTDVENGTTTVVLFSSDRKAYSTTMETNDLTVELLQQSVEVTHGVMRNGFKPMMVTFTGSRPWRLTLHQDCRLCLNYTDYLRENMVSYSAEYNNTLEASTAYANMLARHYYPTRLSV